MIPNTWCRWRPAESSGTPGGVRASPGATFRWSFSPIAPERPPATFWHPWRGASEPRRDFPVVVLPCRPRTTTGYFLTTLGLPILGPLARGAMAEQVLTKASGCRNAAPRHQLFGRTSERRRRRLLAAVLSGRSVVQAADCRAAHGAMRAAFCRMAGLASSIISRTSA